jgi:predicted component of type VI protein secretion system
MRAKWPLREANIKVSENPGQQGWYTVEAWLRPWLSPEELTAPLCVVLVLPRMG